MLEVEAQISMISPEGEYRLAGHGRSLSLTLPREADFLPLWRSARRLRAATLPLARACGAAGMTLAVRWRDHVVARVGGGGLAAWPLVRPAPLGLLSALAAGRRR